MIEIEGDFWEASTTFDALVCPINWTLTKDGELVMGAGLAKQFKEHFSFLPADWGASVQSLSDTAPVLSGYSGIMLIGLPTKKDWRLPSDISLIKKSVTQMVELVNSLPSTDSVLMTRPGCGCGGLKWEEVKSVIEPLLDDRFTVINPKC